ncbi:MAG: MBL fold metallo-hydrolase [Solobacterium sp.]|nr:MBL fold metallo-hydrolase [Solobacterium sp.]
MSLTTVRENILLLAVILFLYVCSADRFPYTAAAAVICYWHLRFHDTSTIILVLCLLLVNIPRASKGFPRTNHGKVLYASERSAVIADGMTRIMVYADRILPLDAEISFVPRFQKIEFPSGFFSGADRYSFKGAYYSISSDQITYIQERKTLKAWIQKRIAGCDEAIQPYLYRSLLNIKTGEEDSFLTENGFSISGITAAAAFLMRYFIVEEKRKKILLGISILLCLFYRFPLLPFLSLIYRLLEKLHLSTSERTGCALTAVIILYPGQLMTASFLIPAVFRLCTCFQEKDRYMIWTASMMTGSLFFHYMDPLRMILFNGIRTVCGFLWFISWIPVLTGISVLPAFLAADGFLAFLTSFRFPGSVLGFGLVFFAVLLYTFRNLKHQGIVSLCALLLFQYFGLFHPFAEVSFINVGQGDSILIRLPLNRENILIDTGKPSAWNAVDTFLKGKAVHRIDTMFITHSDSDHSGNAEQISRNYHVRRIVTEHFHETDTGCLRLYDLNDLKTDDENRNSLVLYFRMGGLRFLMTGDADTFAEERIVHSWPSLPADILKLSHHGSKTGSCDAFLDAVRPSLAVVSAGSYSIYHHPSEETVQRLLKRHIPYLNTKTEGDISIIFLPFMNLLITSSGKIAIMRPS